MANKTKVEIIEETAAFYNLGNRSVNNNGSCKYKGPDGKECAFQRCVETDLSHSEGRSADSVMEDWPELKFKPGYEGHGRQFWTALQAFHDEPAHWNEAGLSSLGLRKKENLIKRFTIEND